MMTQLTPAKSISVQDVQLAIEQLPKDGSNCKRIITFVNQEETKFFKPNLKEGPLEYLLFEWENDTWILKL